MDALCNGAFIIMSFSVDLLCKVAKKISAVIRICIVHNSNSYYTRIHMKLIDS